MALKVLFVTTYDLHAESEWPRTHRGFNGVGLRKYRALADEGHDITACCIPPSFIDAPVGLRMADGVLRRMFGKRYPVSCSARYLRSVADHLRGEIERIRPDAVICADNFYAVAFLDSTVTVPVILWSDAPSTLIVETYKLPASNLARQMLVRLEARALRRCAHVFYTCEWAADYVRQRYGCSSDKIRVLPMGPDLDQPDGACVTREVDTRVAAMSRLATESESPAVCRLLWIGLDWQRKGGDIAVRALDCLRACGIPAELTTIGACPVVHPHVRSLGVLHTREPGGRVLLNRELLRSNFFLLPSRADCTPVSIAEAMSHGVPCVASTVGGIPEMIPAGAAGWTFPISTFAEQSSSMIADTWKAPDRYRAMASAAAQQAAVHLHWRVIAAQVSPLLQTATRTRSVYPVAA